MNRSRFPFPFQSDVYQYSNNLRRLEPPVSIQVTDVYEDEIRYKRALLMDHHDRCYVSDSNTMTAQWEVLDHVLHELADVYPQDFQLDTTGEQWVFHNLRLGEQVTFQYGNRDSLGMDPLDFTGHHVQEDLILMSQRDEKLVLEAGQLCFPGNWSLQFDFGMSFLDIHSPVPDLVTGGLAAKIQRFLGHIEPGRPWARLNWSLHAGHRLDAAPETYDEWGPARYQVTGENLADLVHLRVEEQTLVRLPRSYSLLFTIHTYLMPVQDVMAQPDWRDRFYRVMTSLEPKIVDYKGIRPYYDTLLWYLHQEMSPQP